MRRASDQQAENERQWKKGKKRTRIQETILFVSTYDISPIKRETRKFHVVVVQQQTEGNKQKCALHLDLSRCRCRQALHYCILFFAGINYKYINKSFAISRGLISILYPQMLVSGCVHVQINLSLTLARAFPRGIRFWH